MTETHISSPVDVRTRAEVSQSEEATVLFVEDDPVLRSTLAYNLVREGFRVIPAADGVGALDVVQSDMRNVDVVLLDVMLPGISGLQVLREIRSRSDVPVLLLSARGEEQNRIDGLELGADDYIVKPFALRELMARVRAAARRRAAPAAQPPVSLLRGDLRIEIDRRRVLVGDREILLRPKEFGLLITLAIEPGKVFSRQSLLDTVWGEDVIVDERTVDVHVSWLRGKLRDAGLDGVAIRTVYGAGYQMIVSEPHAHVENGAIDIGSVA
jgi:two-component system phosphate regulon response regulator PhoB